MRIPTHRWCCGQHNGNVSAIQYIHTGTHGFSWMLLTKVQVQVENELRLRVCICTRNRNWKEWKSKSRRAKEEWRDRERVKWFKKKYRNSLWLMRLKICCCLIFLFWKCWKGQLKRSTPPITTVLFLTACYVITISGFCFGIRYYAYEKCDQCV